MSAAPKAIPMQTFRRLPDYYTLLTVLEKQGVENVSSTLIAGTLSITDIVVRKDLAAVSASAGRPRTGFPVRELRRSIGECLGYYNCDDAVLVGVGKLGRALLSYDGFEQYGVKIIAGFDIDEDVVGREQGGRPVMHLSALGGFCRRLGVRMGVITVPPHEAQAVCDVLVAGGVLAVWNFAAVHLSVPEHVFVHDENMSLSLSLLSQHLSQFDNEHGA